MGARLSILRLSILRAAAAQTATGTTDANGFTTVDDAGANVGALGKVRPEPARSRLARAWGMPS